MIGAIKQEQKSSINSSPSIICILGLGDFLVFFSLLNDIYSKEVIILFLV